MLLQLLSSQREAPGRSGSALPESSAGRQESTVITGELPQHPAFCLSCMLTHTLTCLCSAASHQLGNGASCIQATLAACRLTRKEAAKPSQATARPWCRAWQMYCVDVLPSLERVALVRRFSSQGRGFAQRPLKFSIFSCRVLITSHRFSLRALTQ